MKNVFGNAVTLTLFGESHGPAVGAVLDGLAPGIPVDEGEIARIMDLRRAKNGLSTPRREADEVRIVSGVFRGYTTGTPVTFLIENTDKTPSDYEKTPSLVRPGHADYTAEMKYHGYQDARGGGHFSGRLTAPLCAAGALCLTALAKKGILIGTHIARCAGISDRAFSADPTSEIDLLRYCDFAVLDTLAAEKMKAAILRAKEENDSVGGILETAVVGLPAGVGEPWFDTLEGVLSHALFSIPAVKGVEFGDGFTTVDLRGSEANDPFRAENGRVITETNRAGGILGGISNGMPLLFRCAVKPTPSVKKTQKTVDLATGENAEITVSGRHDPAIVHRARAVCDALTALVLCDMLTLRYGTDFLAEGGE